MNDVNKSRKSVLLFDKKKKYGVNNRIFNPI